MRSLGRSTDDSNQPSHPTQQNGIQLITPELYKVNTEQANYIEVGLSRTLYILMNF